MNELPIRVGISACLLGEAVRFDGGHRRDAYMVSTLGQYFSWVPICPEVAIGLGVPREPIRLQTDSDGATRVLGIHTRSDITVRLEHFAAARTATLTDLCGYLCKSQSPSCGMERVKVYPALPGPTRRNGQGVFTRQLMTRYPWLPVEEEGRLGDPRLRENFIQRVFVLHRWQQLLQHGLTAGALVEFHSTHKLIVMAHSQEGYRRLGRWVANADALIRDGQAQDYLIALMNILKRPATPQSHINVLQHLLGYLKKALDSADKAEMLDCLEDYRHGRVPLIVPITLLKHHFRRHPHPYVARQHYLQPHPHELALRSV